MALLVPPEASRKLRPTKATQISLKSTPPTTPEIVFLEHSSQQEAPEWDPCFQSSWEKPSVCRKAFQDFLWEFQQDLWSLYRLRMIPYLERMKGVREISFEDFCQLAWKTTEIAT